MKVNIIFPFIPKKPGGGLRVLFEYANKLSEFGHTVVIYYPCYVSYINERGSLKAYAKYLYRKFLDRHIPEWIRLNPRIKVKFIKEINNDTINDGDVIFSTWWSLMFEIKNLDAIKGKRFNLVQDIENWAGNDAEVQQSYTVAGADNVVIANYLYHYLYRETGKYPRKVPFAIDVTKYHVWNDIAQRDPYSICMMYSDEPRKGSTYGLKALEIVKRNVPEISVKLFSIYEKPADLPDWITYYYRYSNLPELYNSSAIFLGPSVQEGCALPPMEAMYCGCAVVCTDIEGHRDYAFYDSTAILAETQNPGDIADKIELLIKDNNRRIAIATQGNVFVSKHTWDASTKALESVFKETIG